MADIYESIRSYLVTWSAASLYKYAHIFTPTINEPRLTLPVQFGYYLLFLSFRLVTI